MLHKNAVTLREMPRVETFINTGIPLSRITRGIVVEVADV